MNCNDEGFSGPPNDSLPVGRRGRKLPKLVGAVVAALAGIALLCHAMWDLRDEWPLWTVPSAEREKRAFTASDDPPWDRGRRVYEARCVRCHGAEGHGDGAEMANSQVRPRDLASASWRSGANRDAVRRVITEGTPDKLMPGSAGGITARELDSVVDYVFSLAITGLVMRAGLNPGVGQTAPPLTFRDAEGTVGSLDQLRGKVVLLAFWGAHCTTCAVELQHLESLADLYGKADLVVLPVCVDETNARTASEIAARHAPRLPVYVDPDGSVRKRFELVHLPLAVLVDREGRMLASCYEARPWTGKEIEQLLSAGLGLTSAIALEDDAAL